MKITLGSIASYVVGAFLVIVSVPLTIQSPVGLLTLLAGLLVLPFVRRFLESRFDIELSRGVTAATGSLGVVIAIVAVVLIAISAGGGSVENTNTPGSDVSDVSVTAENSISNTPSHLDIEWNSRAQSAVDPDPDDISIYNSNEGQKFVVVRMKIQNTGSEPVELTPQAFILRSDGVEYSYQGLFGSGNSLSDVTLNSGGEYSGWVVFSVPEDMTDAELITDQDAYFQQTVSTNFNRNSGMAINMSD
jgi:hypothetical protein